MDVETKLEKALKSCQRALDEYKNDKKLDSLGSINYILDFANAARFILMNEIEDEGIEIK